MERKQDQLLSEYKTALDSFQDKKSVIYKNRESLVAIRQNKFKQIKTQADRDVFIESLREEKKLIESLNALNRILTRAEDNDIKKAGNDVYQDHNNRVYNLLKQSSPLREDIDLLNKCIQDATGAIKNQGTAIAKKYVANLIQDGKEISSKPDHDWKRSGFLLIILAGTVIAGLTLAGIPLGTSSAVGILSALGLSPIFLKDKKKETSKKLHELSIQTKATLPLPLQTSRFGLSAEPEAKNFLLANQKELIRKVIVAIKSGNFSEDIVRLIYEATKGASLENKRLRRFIEQYIIPRLSEKELFLFTQAVMRHHLVANDGSYMFRTPDLLSTDLYVQFIKRINYSPNMEPQPTSVIALNNIVYTDMLRISKTDRDLGDPKDAAIMGITFQCQYFSMRRQALADSLIGQDPVVNFPEEEKEPDITERMTELEYSVSDNVFLTIEEKKIDITYKKLALKRLDAMQEMVEDRKKEWPDEMKKTLQGFVTTALPIITSSNEDQVSQEYSPKIDWIYKSLTAKQSKMRLNPLSQLCPTITQHDKFHHRMALCIVQIAFKELEESKENNEAITAILTEGRKLYQNKKIQNDSVKLANLAALFIIAAQVIQDPTQANSLSSQVGSIRASELQTCCRNVQSLITTVSPNRFDRF